MRGDKGSKKVAVEESPIMATIDKTSIPEYVTQVTSALNTAGFEAFLVGGCVRDLILKRTPKDWDVTTNATPEQIIPLFTKTFYENTFGTVGVVFENENAEEIKVVEVTPYRTESSYSDGRRPDAVTFSQHIEDDLKRRDFTVNAIAYDPIKDIIVDLYKGQEDIVSKTIRAVGDAKDRFQEDGLRVLRAVRLATDLGFMINTETENALMVSHEMLGKIAKERIRDEFIKIIMSDNPMTGVFMCQRLGILKYIVPELEEGLHTKQNQAHSYGVFEHLLRSLQCAADKGYSLEIRLAALFHDIGKPKSRRYSDEKKDYTFYGHDVIGAEMAKNILNRLHFPNKTIELVTKMVRWHMFFSDTEQISLSAVRRMVANVGKEHIWDLMNLRICDRVGTGRPKENPYRLRKYTAMIEEVMRDPISVSMLKINGKEVIDMLHTKPGPKIGLILDALLEEVLEDPSKNTKEFLVKLARELNELSDDELKKKALSGQKAQRKLEDEQIKEIRKKYFVE